MPDQTWQPIDTAPSDVEILVFTREWGAIIARRSEEHGQWFSRMQVPVSLKADGDLPTHWQQLPAPPDGDDAAEPRAEPDKAAAPSRPPDQ